MGETDQAKAAKRFARAWAGRGYEKGDTQVFWTELLQQVIGLTGISQKVKFEYRTPEGGFIDCLIPDAGVLIEQKGRDIDLDKPEQRQGRMVTPFEQALAYAESFRPTNQPRFIVVCNFQVFRVHDRESCPRNELAEKYLEFTLEELGETPYLLGFITDAARARSEKERQVSMKAGALIGKLYDALRGQYLDPDAPTSAHALNVLCVRLVFCLFCEDAPGLFPKDAFLDYLRKVEPEDMRMALRRLFRALNTPLDERDPYDEKIKPFPYVNGGLFAGDVEIPNFTPEIKHLLLFEVSQETNWAKISPTIFGGIFESTLNPETRHAGGMHYTSPENIHKVIDPLFLDGLYDDLNKALALPVAGGAQTKKLHELHKKIAGLDFLDPACGSGNFLTETYLSLRKIEDDILNSLNNGQTALSFDGEAAEGGPRVRLSQFHGIEVNDFAVRVAKTALWIAQLQANNETGMLLDTGAENFPLADSANIVQANALRLDWNDVLPAAECDYIMGNPPFLGASNCSKDQKAEIVELFGKIKLANSLDYVSGWYYKACGYMEECIRAAFVSTNSICQGEQVYPIWNTLRERFGVHIDFAWRPFVWDSEAAEKAHVHCVIVGFSCGEEGSPSGGIFDSGAGTILEAGSINPYLIDAPFTAVASRKHPLCNVPALAYGNKPSDGGNLVLTSEEADSLIATSAQAKNWLRRYVGAKDFLNGKERWCLWMLDVNPQEILACPEVAARVRAVREFRLASSAADTRKRADAPWEFFRTPVHDVPYLSVPRVSSARRTHLPVGYFAADTIPSDATSVIPEATLFHFGVISSALHLAWLRVVGGRLKSDYRYSGDVVYNNFVWPSPSEAQRAEVERCAQAVLDAREQYAPVTLAELYDPDNEVFFPALAAAHRELDAAVEAAYGIDFGGDEEKIVAHLFRLYAEHAESR